MASRLLQILLQILMTLNRSDEGFIHIFISCVLVVSKLADLPNEQGNKILQLFLSDPENSELLVSTFPKFVEALLQMSKEVY